MAFTTKSKARRFTGILAIALAGAMTFAGTAQAESDWPTGPVKVIMHTKAGGSSDVFIRTLAESLEPIIGQPIVVINSPGGAGASQMSRIRPAEPDGLTLGVNTLTHFTGMLTNLKGTFAIDDFSWIAGAQEDPNLVFAVKGSEIENLDDMVEKAKESGGTVNVGGFGPMGSTQSIAISMLENEAGVDFNWVAFNSTPDIIAAVLGGHVDVGVSNLSGTNPFFDADRIQGVGVLAEKRLGGLPELETFAEQGYDADASWIQVRGIFGPAGIPMETQQKIADSFHEAMATEQYQEYARNSGVTDSNLGPKGYREFVHKVTEVAKRELKAAGVME